MTYKSKILDNVRKKSLSNNPDHKFFKNLLIITLIASIASVFFPIAVKAFIFVNLIAMVMSAVYLFTDILNFKKYSIRRISFLFTSLFCFDLCWLYILGIGSIFNVIGSVVILIPLLILATHERKSKRISEYGKMVNEIVLSEGNNKIKKDVKQIKKHLKDSRDTSSAILK